MRLTVMVSLKILKYPAFDEVSGLVKLKPICLRTPRNSIYPYTDINSVRNKFDSLCSFISSHINIFSTIETKSDHSKLKLDNSKLMHFNT